MRNTEITHVQEMLRHIGQALEFIKTLEFIDTRHDDQTAHVCADLETAMKRGEVLIREWRRDQAKETEQRLKRRYDFVEAPDYDDIT